MIFKKLSLRHAIHAALVSAVCSVSFQAHAEDDVPLLNYDLDGNGAVVAEEVTKARSSLLGAADLDKDGALSASEFVALREAQNLRRFETQFKAIDTDANSSVTLDEFKAFLPAKADAETVFAAAAGEDALLSSAEFTQMRLAQSGASTEALWDFAYIDVNHDQKLTVDEFASSLWKGIGAKLPKLPPIKLPEVKLPEIKLPEVKLPEIKIPAGSTVPTAIKTVTDAIKPLLPVPSKTQLNEQLTKLQDAITKTEKALADLKAKLATQTGLAATFTTMSIQRMEKDLAALKERLAKLQTTG